MVLQISVASPLVGRPDQGARGPAAARRMSAVGNAAHIKADKQRATSIASSNSSRRWNRPSVDRVYTPARPEAPRNGVVHVIRVHRHGSRSSGRAPAPCRPQALRVSRPCTSRSDRGRGSATTVSSSASASVTMTGNRSDGVSRAWIQAHVGMGVKVGTGAPNWREVGTGREGRGRTGRGPAATRRQCVREFGTAVLWSRLWPSTPARAGREGS